MRTLQRQLLEDKSNIKLIRKKGYFLVEIVIALCIFTIISGLVAKLFTSTSEAFRKGIKESREDFYINEAFRYIESEFYDNVKSIEVYDNIIALERLSTKSPGNNFVDEIKLQDQNLVIKYYTNNYLNATNIILRGVEEFSVSKSLNLVFIGIKFKDNRRYEKCLGSNTIK